MSSALKLSKAEKIFLANNRLSTDVIIKILENVSTSIKEINLSDNKITADKQAVETLKKNLESKLEIDLEERKNNVYNFKHYFRPRPKKKPKSPVKAEPKKQPAKANKDLVKVSEKDEPLWEL